MAKQVRTSRNGENIPQKKKISKLKEKVRKHITDINDVITEEDIRTSIPDNTDITKEVDKKEQELEENAKVNDGNEKDNGKTPLTPWDVVKE